MYASSSDRLEIWPMVVEKAFAKLHGTWEAIGHGGLISAALQALTGGVAVSLSTDEGRTSCGRGDALWATLRRAVEDPGVLVGAGTRRDCPDEVRRGIIVGHAYSVLHAVEVEVEVEVAVGRVEVEMAMEEEGRVEVEMAMGVVGKVGVEMAMGEEGRVEVEMAMGVVEMAMVVVGRVEVEMAMGVVEMAMVVAGRVEVEMAWGVVEMAWEVVEMAWEVVEMAWEVVEMAMVEEEKAA